MKITPIYTRTRPGPGAWRYWALAGLIAGLGWSASAAPWRACPDADSLKHHVHPPLSRIFTRAQTYSTDGGPARYGPVYLPGSIVPKVPAISHRTLPVPGAPPPGSRIPDFASPALTTASRPPAMACSADPLSPSLAGPPGQFADSLRSPPGFFPAILKSLYPIPPDRLGTSHQINQAIDPSKWEATEDASPPPSWARTDGGYDDLRVSNNNKFNDGRPAAVTLPPTDEDRQFSPDPLSPAEIAAMRDFPRTVSLKFFEMARAASGDRTPGLPGEYAGRAGDRFNTKENSLRSLNSPCLFASLRDQCSAEAGDDCPEAVALNCGTANVHGLCATPEPSLYLTLSGFLLLAIGAKRRQDRSANLTAI